MNKFNTETNYIKNLDKCHYEECAMYLQALLTTEEHNKLFDDWESIGGYKTIPFWQYCFENINVSYRGE